jgi:uncharacterized protein (TIGR02246 family)
MNGMARAKAYVEASSAHDLDRVEAMFASDAAYVSTSAGTHSGRAAIRAMMDGFFGLFSSLTWESSGWHVDGNGAYAFEFVMTGHNTQSGEDIEKTGHERIWIGDNGLIIRIEVCT